MAKTRVKKKPVEKPEEKPGDVLLGDLSEGGEPSEETELIFQPAVWKPLGPNAEVRIQRRDDFSNRLILHGYLLPSEVTERKISHLFGGGTYRAQILSPNESGLRVVRNTKDFTLKGVYKPPGDNLPGMDRAVSTERPIATMSQGGEIRSAVDNGRVSINEALNMVLLDRVLDVVKTSKEIQVPRFDWGPLVVAGLDIAKEMLARKPEGPDPRLLDRLDRMHEQITAMKAQPGPITGGISDVAKAMRELLGLRAELNDTGPPADPETKMFEFGEKLLGVMTANRPLGAEGGAGVGSPVPLVAYGGNGLVNPVIDPNAPAWDRLLRTNGRQMVAAAEHGFSATVAADVTLQMAGDQVGSIEELLRRPDAVDIIGQVVPPMKNYPSWTAQFVQALREVLFEQEGTDEPDVAD